MRNYPHILKCVLDILLKKHPKPVCFAICNDKIRRCVKPTGTGIILFWMCLPLPLWVMGENTNIPLLIEPSLFLSQKFKEPAHHWGGTVRVVSATLLQHQRPLFESSVIWQVYHGQMEKHLHYTSTPKPQDYQSNTNENNSSSHSHGHCDTSEVLPSVAFVSPDRLKVNSEDRRKNTKSQGYYLHVASRVANRHKNEKHDTEFNFDDQQI
ncbi:uncharacterized protein [Narcine bancroftii]|uniref:uncharacterized protein n=1 Tax=Narcine bancroftii TaxID=1343680 RepID=UPI0038318713